MLDYDYFKNHYNLIVVDLSKQTELDADSRGIQQIEYYEMLKTNSQVCQVYSKVNVKLLDRKLKQPKTTVKDKSGRTLKMSLKMLHGNDLPHDLVLTTRQKAKLRNAFNNNISTF